MLHISSRSRLSWAAALLMVVALGAADSAFAVTASQKLGAELPAGVTLRTAKLSQTVEALGKAVAATPESAVALTDAAISAESSKKRGLSCAGLRSLVDAASASAPGKSREIVESAMSMKPECSQELNGSLNAPRTGSIIGAVGDEPTLAAQGFGAGLGAGFAGSPGFIGSSPSGATAFPPVVVTPLTNVTNP